ncbi:arsenite efflux transporter, partial [Colletotrichum scovillei]
RLVRSRDNVPPQQASQRCAEGSAEGSIVDAKSHAVDRRPESALADGYTVFSMDLLPCLYHAGE